MLNIIIIIAAILILVILFAIFRVSSLVDVIKGDSSTKIPSSNGIQANLLLLFLIAGLVGGFYYSFGGLEQKRSL
jgi:p-aminobenzoyl-glutamate transporter AbgT